MKSKTFWVFAAAYLVLTSALVSGAGCLFKLPIRDVLGNLAGIHLGFLSMYGLHRFVSKHWPSKVEPKKTEPAQSSASKAFFPPECADMLRMTKAQLDAEIKALEPIMDRGAATYKAYANLLQRLGTRPAEDFILTIDDGQYVKACYRDMHLRHVRNMLFRQPNPQTKAMFS